MDLTFEEKSSCASLLLILAAYGSYGLSVLRGTESATLGGMLSSMIAIVIVLVVLEIVIHIWLAAFHPPEARDERAVLIAARSSSYGFYVLGAGVVTLLFYILINGAIAEGGEAVVMMSSFWIANALLLAMVIAEVVHYASLLILYRRGI